MTTKLAKTKFPSKARLAAIGIRNSHEIASLGPDPVFVYDGQEAIGGRSSTHISQVHRTGEKSDPGGSWYNYGHKTFYPNGVKKTDAKKDCLARALAWTDEKYGRRTWVRDPWGSYQDSRVIAAIWAAIDKKEELG